MEENKCRAEKSTKRLLQKSRQEMVIILITLIVVETVRSREYEIYFED